ncbi:MAG: ATP-NAD kinase [Dehalococcoidia bacterium]|nr:ATP-NAD kinase [Dehalococcoidia bacterium]
MASSPTPAVGIIANPAAGKDIRRLVAHGRFVTNQEKVNILRRVLAGVESVGVRRVVFMPDMSGLGHGSLDGGTEKLSVEFVDILVTNKEVDSTRAAEVMQDLGVGCLVTLGGDGTNRAVAKGAGDIPIIPISTGTNNVFPQMMEGTVAGIAAGVVASGMVDVDAVTRRSTVMEVSIDGTMRDIALVDVAVSTHQFIGARALWDIDTITELFLARTDADAIGLSAIGARLRPSDGSEHSAVHVTIGPGGETVDAPIAPGVVTTVPVSAWKPMAVGEAVDIGLRPCTIALDGERALSVGVEQSAQVTLRDSGPLVVDVEKAIREATRLGVFGGVQTS